MTPLAPRSIEDDPSRLHFLSLRSERCEHSAEVECARLDEVGRGLRVHKGQILLLQLREVPAESLRVRDDPRRRLLEGHEDPGLRALPSTMGQELQGQYGFPAARPPISSVVRPRGNPPLVISSRPATPVLAFTS